MASLGKILSDRINKELKCKHKNIQKSVTPKEEVGHLKDYVIYECKECGKMATNEKCFTK